MSRDVEDRFAEWWETTKKNILCVSIEESNNDRVQTILALAGQELTDGMYTIRTYVCFNCTMIY